MGTLHTLCTEDELQPGQCGTFFADGRPIALFNVGGTFYALENECTHEGGPLGEGIVEGDHVYCPWHGAEFDVKTGAVLSAPADQPVEAFRVE